MLSIILNFLILNDVIWYCVNKYKDKKDKIIIYLKIKF